MSEIFGDIKNQGNQPPGGKFDRFVRTFWIYVKVILVYYFGIHCFIRNFIKQKKIDKSKNYSGRVCAMTGGTGGIGLEVVKTLLELDFTVIVGVRNIKRMTIEVANIRRNGIKTGQAKILKLDLKSFESIRKFSDEVLNLPEVQYIDMLINHAGIFQNKYEVTEDNIECHFQVNYLSHFLLTNLLLPRIKETAEARKGRSICHIINSSSHVHFAGSLEFDNLFEKRMYIPPKCYFDTKLCAVLHAKSLQNELEKEGIRNIQVYAPHPGEVLTDIWNDATVIVRSVLDLICESKENAVNNILYPALDPILYDICGGKYFENCREIKSNQEAENEEVRKLLWQMSMELTVDRKRCKNYIPRCFSIDKNK